MGCFTPIHYLHFIWLFFIEQKEVQFQRPNVTKNNILIHDKSATFHTYDLASHAAQMWVTSWLASTRNSLLTFVCLLEEHSELATQVSSK